MKQYFNNSLKDFHTFHTHEKAALITILESKAEAVEFFKKPPAMEKRQIIGEGSNLLFEKDYDGEIIKYESKGIEIIEEKGNWAWIKVAGGENWDDFVAWAGAHGYGGVENLSYIPGTLGAAPVQNIGAYGVELLDVFNSLEAVCIANGELRNFYLQEMDFDYRYSIFKGPLKDQYLVLNVVLKLARYPKVKLDYGHLKEETYRITTKNIPDIADVRQAVINIRKSKLPEPDEIGNAGSFFKNPIIELKHFEKLVRKYPLIANYPLKDGKIKIAAAWLIEQCGLRGVSSGDAGTHEKHALILINKGNASGRELKEFSEMIQNKVYEKFAIQLEPEVRII